MGIEEREPPGKPPGRSEGKPPAEEVSARSEAGKGGEDVADSDEVEGEAKLPKTAPKKRAKKRPGEPANGEPEE